MTKKTRKPAKSISDALSAALYGTPPEELNSGEVAEPNLESEEDSNSKASDSPDTETTGLDNGTGNGADTDVPAKDEAPAKTEASTVPDSSLTDHLKTEIKELKAEAKDREKALLKLEASIEALNSTIEELTEFSDNASEAVRQMTERLSIGLGSKAVGLETAKGAQLLTLWASVKTEFDKRFLRGGKSTSQAVEQGDEKTVSDLGKSRRVKATQSIK